MGARRARRSCTSRPTRPSCGGRTSGTSSRRGTSGQRFGTSSALNNHFQQLEVYREPKVQDRIVERHEANDGLFQAFFDKPEFKEQMLKWLTKSLYDGSRKDSVGARSRVDGSPGQRSSSARGVGSHRHPLPRGQGFS